MQYTPNPIYTNDAQLQRLAVATCKLVEFVRKMPGGRELIARKMAQTRAERGESLPDTDSETCT